MPNDSISMPIQVSSLKIPLAEIPYSDTALVEISPIETSLIEELSTPSTLLASLTLVKQGHRQAKKHPK